MKVILGIDPGLAETGYGFITVDNNQYHHLAHGVIRTPASDSIGSRLLALYDQLSVLIEQHRPADAGIESLFFARNVSSAIPVAQARGVVLLLLQRHGVFTAEYSPQAIKQAIVGQGRAEKRQVQDLVRVLLGLAEIPRPDHAADALAAAICHHNSKGVAERIATAQRDS